MCKKLQNTLFQGKHRFYRVVKINRLMMAGDTDKIIEEVVKYLTCLSKVDVIVTLEIHTNIHSGIPSGVQQAVEGNCCTLRFDNIRFEEEQRIFWKK